MIPYLIEPWQHQETAIQQAKSQQDYALFFEMGCGKTSTCINILRQKYAEERRLMRTLILCPPIVISNWQREFAMHSKIKEWDIIPLIKTQRERVNTLKTFAYRHEVQRESIPDGKILITNYESMLMLDLFGAIAKWKPEIVVCDESHRCKDYKAKRTKAVIELAMTAKHRYLLTGTPILNSAMDIFSQFYILDRGLTFGKSFYSFRAKYFYDKNAGMPKSKYFPDWQPLPGAMEEINQAITAKSARATKQECLDLPPLVTQNIYVELNPLQKRLYNSMKNDFIAYIDDKACVATLAITKGLRMMQIASGFINVEEEHLGLSRKNIQLADNPRAKALEELLTEITVHSKVLVWAVFKENYDTIRAVCKAVGVNFVEVHGDVSAAQKEINVKTFNEDPACRVLIGHPASGGIGINLVAASYSIFYSRNFSLEQDLQAEARNHRGGSEIHTKITRINIVAKDTIDELITDALAKKQTISDTILKKLILNKEGIQDGPERLGGEDLHVGEGSGDPQGSAEEAQ